MVDYILVTEDVIALVTTNAAAVASGALDILCVSRA
jgi:hypothetical protein